MEINVGGDVNIDAQLMLTGRCCVIGQSGSGKSYLVGVIAEELSRNGLPYVIIDTEGEYNSLKSAFEMLWVGGDGADLPMNVDYAKLLTKSIENSIPVIFDVSDEIDKSGRVESLLSALYTIEEKARSPYLVIIEEADKFTPQVLHKNLNRVEEISVRGRKRGIGLLVATQRPANINKNVLAQCSYGFVGKLTIENDIKAVNVLFDDKRQLAGLPSLKTGEFMSFGIAENGKFRVKARSVAHGGATPLLVKKERTGVSVAGLIKEIKGQAQRQQPRKVAVRAGSDSSALVLKESVDENFARAYAARILRKKFLVFGEQVEELESVSERYMPICAVKLMLPTGKKNEFEDHYAFVDGRHNAISLDGSVHKAGVLPSVRGKLSDVDRKILAVIGGKGTGEIESMARFIGITEGDAFKAIDRLEDKGLITIDRNRIRVQDRRQMLARRGPEFLDRVIASADIYGAAAPAKEIRDIISLAFPSATITETIPCYLPFFEITLRMRDRVRVFRIDALFGKEIDLTLLD